MKILWLNAGLLLPLDKGGKLRTWHLMRHLAQRHDITYLSFPEPAQRHEHRAGMREVCQRLQTVPRTDPAKGTLRFYADAARTSSIRCPMRSPNTAPPTYAGACRPVAATGRFDAVVAISCRRLAICRPAAVPRRPLHAQRRSGDLAAARRDADQSVLARADDAAVEPHAALRARRARRVSTWCSRYRRPTARRSPASIPARSAGRCMSSRPGSTRRTSPPCRGPERRAHLVFTGSMDWLPNEDGMLYFVRDILPRIRQAEPEVTLSIIGRAPTPAVRSSPRSTASRSPAA